jgi:hypothetical protein
MFGLDRFHFVMNIFMSYYFHGFLRGLESRKNTLRFQANKPLLLLVKISTIFQQYFNNISAISWWSVLLEEDINGNFQYQEKVTWLSSATDKLYHIMLYQVHLSMDRIQLTSLVAMVINCIDT